MSQKVQLKDLVNALKCNKYELYHIIVTYLKIQHKIFLIIMDRLFTKKLIHLL
jgi:hypothetical protein